MKNLVLAFTSVLLFTVSSFSQINKGNWELSLSGDMGFTSSSTESTYGAYHEEYDGTSEGYFLVALRVGYFVVDGLEIEPEFIETAVEKETPCFDLGSNVLYNFKIANSSISPFVLAGYGVGNSIPFSNALFYNATGSLDIGHWNLGAGVKFFINKNIGIRVEYRHQQYSYDQNEYNVSTSYKLYYNKLLVGISFCL